MSVLFRFLSSRKYTPKSVFTSFDFMIFNSQLTGIHYRTFQIRKIGESCSSQEIFKILLKKFSERESKKEG